MEPNARLWSDWMLQQARPALTEGRIKQFGDRNAPSDTDGENFSLQRFLDLALAGQSPALEMLFKPDPVLTRTSCSKTWCMGQLNTAEALRFSLDKSVNVYFTTANREVDELLAFKARRGLAADPLFQ